MTSAALIDRTDHAAPPRTVSPWVRAVIAVGTTVGLMSVVRATTDSPDLTSSGTVETALRLGTPILLAALGGIFSERAGIVNIGLEGMMIMGTWGAGWAGYQWGPWQAVGVAIVAGALGGLLHAVATVTFRVDQIISGVAINILGAGVARFLSVTAYEDLPAGGATQSPPIDGDLSDFSFPILAGGFDTPDVLANIDRRNWFFISDLAGMLRGMTGDLSPLIIIALLLVPLSAFVLWRTSFGLRLRSSGEHPVAADSLGVNVYLQRYLAVVISGALAGLGGAILVVESGGIYREGQTQGKGFIGLAALIFGNWLPVGAAAGSFLFGMADALRLRDAETVHALLLLAAITLGLLTAVAVVRRRPRAAITYAVVGGLALVWWLATDSIPSAFVSVTPHLVTLLVLAFAATRLRPPRAEGLPFRKGQLE